MQVMHGLRDEDNVESCQDEIDESLENLLIFPTHMGLKRCFDLSKCPRLCVSLSLAHCSNSSSVLDTQNRNYSVEEYFRLEIELMRARGYDEATIVDGHERIRAITSSPLGRGGRKDPFASCDSG